MAYTLNQVLELNSLSEAQKTRAKEWFKAAYRTQPKQQDADGNDLRKREDEITITKKDGEETVEISNLTALKEFLNDLIKKHDKRVEANAKKKAAKAADEEKLLQLKELVESAAEYDMSFDDVLEAVSKTFRDKKNAKLREQIAALQAQIVE